MRQQLTMGEHFRRGNARSHPDCRAIPGKGLVAKRNLLDTDSGWHMRFLHRCKFWWCNDAPAGGSGS
jgi:hypothetical protein